MLERESAKIAIDLNLASAKLSNLPGGIAERETEQSKVLEASYATEQELTRARKLLADLHAGSGACAWAARISAQANRPDRGARERRRAGGAAFSRGSRGSARRTGTTDRPLGGTRE